MFPCTGIVKTIQYTYPRVSAGGVTVGTSSAGNRRPGHQTSLQSPGFGPRCHRRRDPFHPVSSDSEIHGRGPGPALRGRESGPLPVPRGLVSSLAGSARRQCRGLPAPATHSACGTRRPGRYAGQLTRPQKTDLYLGSGRDPQAQAYVRLRLLRSRRQGPTGTFQCQWVGGWQPASGLVRACQCHKILH